ncbi:NAD(+) diphosphatase [Sphingomonas abietis]|uniref:NAD(+) diphosphatase n=1 Tax=Sphingomonas abietis TaxID=3012344 RepID=A0ABY7NT07_9SPHN|nr:NAD(+) diphosphatase [Sphingomonas abietis]WBO23084.1 NAD(+) diphosphatase [Sphingomonas abietis]
MTLPGFTGSLLDRADEARHDEAVVGAMRADPDALLLDMDGLHPIGAEQGALGWTRLRHVTIETELALLGTIEGTPRFVALQPGVSAVRRTPELFAAITALPASDAGTYATARSLVDWHARHGFCANCGTATLVFRAGWGRACPACHAQHFPRVDPVVIMLAQHGRGADARIVVGRQPAFPPGRYSALAGFLEPGESIEEAVARELKEEAGVTVHSVRYLASQPWPFPSQLMIACIGLTDDDALTIDRTELEEAFWVTRTEVAAALAHEPGARFLPPPPYAIAHTLLSRWLTEA